MFGGLYPLRSETVTFLGREALPYATLFFGLDIPSREHRMLFWVILLSLHELTMLAFAYDDACDLSVLKKLASRSKLAQHPS